MTTTTHQRHCIICDNNHHDTADCGLDDIGADTVKAPDVVRTKEPNLRVLLMRIISARFCCPSDLDAAIADARKEMLG